MTSLSRLGKIRLALAAGVAVPLVLAANTAPQAALTEHGMTPALSRHPLVLAQAPAAAAPNVDANIAELHQRLQITPAQEPQFNAIANVMRQNARMMSSPPPANPNAVETLRLAIQYGQQEIDGMRRLLPALQALYASLSPAQRQTADAVFRQGPGE
ncbi:MAG: Spy/CpxP family protein refolding chaperone [Stellaceae bacterium]